MGIIAWIAVGLIAGLFANVLLPGKRSRGLIFTGLVGITAVVGGDWTADLLRTSGQARGLTRRWETPGRWNVPEGSS